MPSVLVKNQKVVGVSEGVKLDFIRNQGAGIQNHTVAIILTDANSSITAITVNLEGSIDVNDTPDSLCSWFGIGQKIFSGAELTAKKAMLLVVNTPLSRVRSNILTLTGANGTTDSVTILYQEGR